MGTEAVTPLRLYRRIADIIRIRIARGEFRPGGRLPTERDLARQFGVSRQVVREAIVALEMSSLVEVRGGSGVYVGRAPGADAKSVQLVAQRPGPVEIIDARLVVEPEIAALAARRRLPTDLELMHEAILELIEELKVDCKQEKADRRFHVVVAQSTRNDLLVSMVNTLWDEVESPFYTRVQYFAKTAERRADWIEHHKQIFEAIAASDARRAKAAMRHHLNQVNVALNKI